MPSAVCCMLYGCVKVNILCFVAVDVANPATVIIAFQGTSFIYREYTPKVK